jgi:2-polyprenyl-6-hydroxyphenyl methylase/3-demethylubiquinone-9 3-methyltransferase
MIAVHAPYLVGARFAVRALTGRLQMERGMSLWYDMQDWLGGWPFEVARPEDVVARFEAQGFTLEREKTCGTRMGCNEFVFRFTQPCSAARPSPRPPSARASSGT